HDGAQPALPHAVPRGFLFREFLHAAVGELVGAFVARITGMAPDPRPRHVVTRDELIEFTPQLGIRHRLLRRGAPAVALPAVDPLGHPLHHVLGIHVQLHPGGASEGLQPADDGGEFHAVVRRLPLTAEDLLRVRAVLHQHAPATAARVPLARTIGPHPHRNLPGTIRPGATRPGATRPSATRPGAPRGGIADAAAHARAPRTGAKKPRPSVEGPNPGSTAFSGAARRPTTLPASLLPPAIPRAGPVGFVPAKRRTTRPEFSTSSNSAPLARYCPAPVFTGRRSDSPWAKLLVHAVAADSSVNRSGLETKRRSSFATSDPGSSPASHNTWNPLPTPSTGNPSPAASTTAPITGVVRARAPTRR